jgi:DNA-binding transcriptional MerR regulator
MVARTEERPGALERPGLGGETLPIAGVSERLQIPVPTIRSWERRYGFPLPRRTPGRHRRYGPSELEQLRELRDLIARGHPTREAVELVRGRPPTPRRPEVEALLRAGIELSPAAAADALRRATEELGPERAAVEVALPALREVGARWQVGTCDVASEHLVSDAVRAWLARLTAFAPARPGALGVVLACGPTELHTIGLEALGMLLALRQLPVILLGARTPTDALVRTVCDTRATAAVVVAQRGVNRRPTVASVAAVARLHGVHAFYAGGAFGSAVARRRVPGTYLGADLIAAADRLEALLT